MCDDSKVGFDPRPALFRFLPGIGGPIVLAVTLGAITGCAPEDGGKEAPRSEEPQRRTPALAEGLPPSEGVDTAPFPSRAGDSGVTVLSFSPGPFFQTGGSGDTAYPIPLRPPGEAEHQPPPAQAPDTALPRVLEARLSRLEAENDSLRIALGALLGVLGADSRALFGTPGAGTAGESQTDSVGLATQLLGGPRRHARSWGIRIVAAGIFLFLTALFIRPLVWVLEKLAERDAKRRLFFKRLVPIARISIWFLAILFASTVLLRIEAQGLLAAGAALGVAVGFAAQDILKNIFGGLLVLFDQPFQVGDKISVGGTYGEVVSIGLRSTRIVTPEDSLVSVPNAQVVDSQVSNANAGEMNCQVVTDLYLPGWVDEGEAKRIAFEAAAGSRYVFLNKPIVVLVKDEFQETFLTRLRVKAYVLDPRYENLLMSDVTERARAGFRKAGLLGPMHGVRAYVDVDRFPEMMKAEPGSQEGR